MFNKEKIKEFIDHDWRNMLDKTAPKNDNKNTFNEEEVETIKNGSIIMLVSSVIICFTTVLLALAMVPFFENYSIFKFKSTYNVSFSPFSFIFVPIFLLVYINLNKDKEHNSLIEFIIGIVLLVKGLYSILSLIGWLGSILINPIWALIGLLCELTIAYGIILVLNGLIPFCIRANENVKTTTKTAKTTKKTETKKSKPKYCSECGEAVVGKFCANCGKKIGE